MAYSYQKTLIVLSLVVMFMNCAFAHTYLSSISFNGQALSEGDCMRPQRSQNKEYPLSSVTSQEMTCGWLPEASRPANRKCPIEAGSKIGLQWYHNYAQESDFIIEATHKGPIMVYLSKADNAAGNGWFKIYEAGYDSISQKWATDKLIANRGKLEVTIPIDIAPGNYLLRTEVLALHNAYDTNGIQPYVSCVELAVSGSGSASPQGVAFPGAYTPTGPGMIFNVYNDDYTRYTIPGPAVYRAGSSPAPASSTNPPNAAPTTRPITTPTQAPATPTAAPAYQPAQPASSSIKIKLNQGSNTWWVGLALSGANQPIAKVDIKDGAALTSWAPLNDLSYAWVFSQSVQIAPLLSVRITCQSGRQIEVSNAFTSWDDKITVDTYANC